MEEMRSSLNQNPTEVAVQRQNGLSNGKLFIIISISILLTGAIIGGSVYFWQKSVSEDEINNLRQEIATLKNQATKAEDAKTTSSPTTQSTSPTPINEPVTKKFSYKNFSLNYPSDWILMDMSKDENFPLKSRLSSLSEKAIALSKNGLYLIITVDQGTKGEAGGVFVDDTDYNEFISTKDKVIIQDSTFYLDRSHSCTFSLLESEVGPWGWSALLEYVPSKITQSGKVFSGYNNIIKRDGYTYNFIVTSNETGITDTQLQGEIIDILETIEW